MLMTLSRKTKFSETATEVAENPTLRELRRSGPVSQRKRLGILSEVQTIFAAEALSALCRPGGSLGFFLGAGGTNQCSCR